MLEEIVTPLVGVVQGKQTDTSLERQKQRLLHLGIRDHAAADKGRGSEAIF